MRLEYGSWAFIPVSFETEAKDFKFSTFLFCCHESRKTQYKVNTQSMRLFGLRNVHAEDVHHVDANRLGKKKASENPVEKGHGYSRVSDDWYSNITDDSLTSTTAWYNSRYAAWKASDPLDFAHHPTHVVLELGCTRSIGSRKAIRRFQQYAMYRGITTKCCPCNKSFVFANSEVGTCFEICIVNFPTTPPCSTRVDVLETGDVPILFSPPQMKILGITLELNQTRDKTTCPAFGLYSSPVEYSTMGHIVLDLTGLAYQPKSRERSARPTNDVTYALSPLRSYYRF